MSSYKPREVVLKKDLPNLKESIVNDFRPQISAMQEQINLVKSLSQPKGNYIERKDIKLLSSTDLPLLASASSVGDISQLTKYNGQSLVYAINDISDNMVTKAEANSKYQPKGEYALKSELSNITLPDSSDYVKKADLTRDYYTKETIDNTWGGLSGAIININYSEDGSNSGNVYAYRASGGKSLLPVVSTSTYSENLSELTNMIATSCLDVETADGKYQPKGEYAGKSELSNYYTKTEADDKYQVKGEYAGKNELASYYTKTEADGKYQVKGEYQPKGEYAGKSELSNYYTKTEADGKFKDEAAIVTIVESHVNPVMESYINPLAETINGLDNKYATRKFVEDTVDEGITGLDGIFQPAGDYALKSDYYNKQASDDRYVAKDKVQSILDAGGVSPEVQMMINAMSVRINSLTTACSQVDDKIFLTDMMAKLSKINAEIDSRT